jgi:hypothetical protein
VPVLVIGPPDRPLPDATDVTPRAAGLLQYAVVPFEVNIWPLVPILPFTDNPTAELKTTLVVFAVKAVLTATELVALMLVASTLLKNPVLKVEVELPNEYVFVVGGIISPLALTVPVVVTVPDTTILPKVPVLATICVPFTEELPTVIVVEFATILTVELPIDTLVVIAVLPATVKVLENDTVLSTARVPSVSIPVDVITVLTVELPTLTVEVFTVVLAPTFTADEAFAVVVFMPPLRVVKPVAVIVFESVRAPVIAAVLVTLKLDEMVRVQAVETLPPRSAVFAKRVVEPKTPFTVPLPVLLLPDAVPSTVTT